MLLRHTYEKEPKARFAEGSSVYLDFNQKGGKDLSKIEGPYIVKKAIFQGITRIFMYTFENYGAAVGEMYLKEDKFDKKLSITECMHETDQDKQNMFGEIKNAFDKNLQSGRTGVGDQMGFIWFEPDKKFIDWIVEYAAGRIIIEVGSGVGFVLERMADAGGRVVGIEPDWDPNVQVKFMQRRIMRNEKPIHVLSKKIENCGSFFQGQGNKVLLLFTRPSHSGYVERALTMKDADTEALYISKEENLKLYNDLGQFDSKKVLIKHEGWSVEKEVVYSIK